MSRRKKEDNTFVNFFTIIFMLVFILIDIILWGVYKIVNLLTKKDLKTPSIIDSFANAQRRKTKRKKVIKQNKHIQEREKLMDAYNLEEWQKELVREGRYDVHNFGEGRELEDDDYYKDNLR